MKKNEERIWDVLIEDALREQPLEQSPPGEHTRRLLQPVGPLGVDRGRSMRHGGRHKWIPAAVAVTALLVVAAIFYGGAVWLPKLSEANQTTPDQPQSAEDTNQTPSREQQSPEDQPSPEPEEQPQPELQEDPQPGEDPSPEPPPKTPEQPKPTPEPVKPDDQVEQPEPDPQPEPEPAKPDDVVEQPKQPEDTTPAAAPGPTILLLRADNRARLEFSRGDDVVGNREYVAVGDRTEFPSGIWLACRRPVDLLADGVQLRLEGELYIRIAESGLELQLEDDDLFIDSRGSNVTVKLTVSSHPLTLASGAALVEKGASGVDVTVFDGEVRVQDEIIPAGKRGVLKKRGLTGLYDPRDSMDETPFLEGLGNRVVYREDFDADPDGRLREGELAEGVVSGGTVFWGYPQNIAYEPGLVIRLRVRFTRAAQATLTQFCEELNDNYSVDLKDLKRGEWFVLEVRVDDFVERTTHEGHPQVGESFMNVSLNTTGENAQVELDWVELIRAVK